MKQLEAEFSDNEEKRRYILEAFTALNPDQAEFKVLEYDVRNGKEITTLEISPNLEKLLKEDVLKDILSKYIKAQLLNDSYLTNESDRNRYYTKFWSGMEMLQGIEDTSKWKTEYGKRQIWAIRPDKEAADRGARFHYNEATKTKAAADIKFLNEMEAARRFIYDSASDTNNLKNRKGQLDHNQNTWKMLSPIRDNLRSAPPEFRLMVEAQLTPDDVLYGTVDADSVTRVSSVEAINAAQAFSQGLSNTLNDNKLQHERRVVTPEDLRQATNTRLLAAEQAALEGKRREEEASERVRVLEEEKFRLEGEVEERRNDIAQLKNRLGELKKTAELEGVEAGRRLGEATASQRRLESEKSSLRAQLETANGAKDALEVKLRRVLDQLETAESEAGVLGGNLRDVASPILEEHGRETKAMKKRKQ